MNFLHIFLMAGFHWQLITACGWYQDNKRCNAMCGLDTCHYSREYQIQCWDICGPGGTDEEITEIDKIPPRPTLRPLIAVQSYSTPVQGYGKAVQGRVTCVAGSVPLIKPNGETICIPGKPNRCPFGGKPIVTATGETICDSAPSKKCPPNKHLVVLASGNSFCFRKRYV